MNQKLISGSSGLYDALLTFFEARPDSFLALSQIVAGVDLESHLARMVEDEVLIARPIDSGKPIGVGNIVYARNQIPTLQTYIVAALNESEQGIAEDTLLNRVASRMVIGGECRRVHAPQYSEALKLLMDEHSIVGVDLTFKQTIPGKEVGSRTVKGYVLAQRELPLEGHHSYAA
ncbi:hypothetical protein HN587_05005 [Candidatus Woesearchaeota archaeon]|jgi:hypothetical protein|nr:hypothetical protein [Candidatus Woesearchaeota archaeon]